MSPRTQNTIGGGSTKTYAIKGGPGGNQYLCHGDQFNTEDQECPWLFRDRAKAEEVAKAKGGTVVDGDDALANMLAASLGIDPSILLGQGAQG